MDSYGYISAIALFIYVAMMLIFLAAKRNRIVNSFLLVLLSMICWTGGSCFMRALLWPNYIFWYHVSLFGLLCLPYAYYLLVNAMAEKEGGIEKYIYPVMLGGLFLLNIPGGMLFHWPVIVHNGENIRFVYDKIDWKSVIFFAAAGIVVIHTLYNLIQCRKKNRKHARQMNTVIAGIVIVLGGNIALMFPVFAGFPIDILAGLINAFFLVYALAQRNLFEVTLLVSETACTVVGFLISVLLFWFLTPYLRSGMEQVLPGRENHYMVIYSAIFMFCVWIFMEVWKHVISNTIVRDEAYQAEVLREFNTSVSKSLSMKNVLQELVEVIRKGCHIETVYICIASGEQGYQMMYSNNPLHDRSFRIKTDNPLIGWMQQNEECTSLDEFYHTVEFKSMWESEKQQLKNLKAQWCIGLKNEDGLIGVVFLSDKEKHKKIGSQDRAFLNSVATISSIAIKNASLYEKISEEARTDELTGLYNRKYFYELLHETFEENKEGTMVLAMLNVDDFKLYNQLYGMKAGDTALKKIADIIRASVGNSGSVARYGGKEFAVLLPKYDVYAAKLLVESICDQIRQMHQEEKTVHLKQLTVSAGISAAPYAAHTEKELLDNADLAVYHVKHQGKNNIYIYDIAEKELEKKNKKESNVQKNREYDATIFALTAAIDAKDHYTFSHSNNVMYYATGLASEMGLDEEFVEIIRQAALMHDVGKIGIPEQILSKPGRLTEEEYEIMKGHVESSIEIIRHLPSLNYVIPAVIGHHERYDGKGYPRRIAGEDIPLSARILGISDAFDAMISKRCYKQAQPLEKVLGILKEEAGKQFDPNLVPIFIQAIESGKIKVIYDAGQNSE